MSGIRTNQRGFTLIELIVVIVIIGILAAVATFGFGQFQAQGRDAMRSTSATAIAEALEAYFDENGEYPSCSALTGNPQTISSEVLVGINTGALVVPNAPDGTQNSLRCEVLTIDGEDFYEYEVPQTANCLTGSACLRYTLRYKSETNNEIVEIASRRTASVAGAIDNLNATPTGLTTISVTWTGIEDATSYTLQRATNSAFSTGLVNTSVTSSPVTASGLSAGITYYFRVIPVTPVGNGTTSNTDTATTRTLATPSLAISPGSLTQTQVTVTWGAIQDATQYRIRYATNPEMTSPVTLDNLAASPQSRTISGLIPGGDYYMQIQAFAPGDTSDWSANLYVAVPITSIPTIPTVNLPTFDTSASPPFIPVEFSWSSSYSCPAGTVLNFNRKTSRENSSGSWSSNITTTTYRASFGVGYNHRIEVRSLCVNPTTGRTGPLSAVGSNSRIQPVPSPYNLGWTANRLSPSRPNFARTGSCYSGSSLRGDFDLYSRDLPWRAGPNSGNTGWLVPGGYWVINGTMALFVDSSFNIPNGYLFAARANARCVNSITGRASGYIYAQSPNYIWGQNL